MFQLFTVYVEDLPPTMIKTPTYSCALLCTIKLAWNVKDLFVGSDKHPRLDIMTVQIACIIPIYSDSQVCLTIKTQQRTPEWQGSCNNKNCGTWINNHCYWYRLRKVKQIIPTISFVMPYFSILSYFDMNPMLAQAATFPCVSFKTLKYMDVWADILLLCQLSKEYQKIALYITVH